MSTEFHVVEMLTGRSLGVLPTDQGDWEIATNSDDSVTCAVPARSFEAAAFRIWQSTPVARSGIVAVVDGEPVAGGPLWKRDYRQGAQISFTAGGLLSYWDRRVLLPVSARGQALVTEDGEPDPQYDTNLSGLSYGTIVKRWVQLVRAWPGGSIPMKLPVDELGTRERNIAAVDLKRLRGLIDNITEVENGPDVAFRVRRADDGVSFYWELITGTNARPRIGQTDASLIQWTVGAAAGGASGLSITEDGTSMAEEVFVGGGRADDVTLVAQARNPRLAEAGYPLLQSVDNSHTDVVFQSTMQGYANQGAKLGAQAASFWSMTVRAQEKGTPKLGEYWLGDMATITVDPAEPVLGHDKPYGVERRIARISGSQNEDAYGITFAEALA